MAAKNSPQKSQAPAQENGKQRPAHEIRLGRIKATIWANQNDNGTWYNVTLSRSYKDGDEWKWVQLFPQHGFLHCVGQM